jgi:hypothetical protein
VFDDVADFVGMCLQHDDALRLPGQGGPGGAVGITGDLRSVLLDPVRPNLLTTHFKAGGARRFEEVEEEISVFFFHVKGRERLRWSDLLGNLVERVPSFWMPECLGGGGFYALCSEVVDVATDEPVDFQSHRFFVG